MSRYENRTVEWGHWGITFMEVQPDQTKNYGAIIGHVSFPVGTRGPCDLPRRAEYKEMCRAWVEDGARPAELFVRAA